MNKAKVSIVRAYDYDCVQIRSAVEKGIKLIGGLERVVKPSDSVFVKINHLPPPSPPEKGIITHPVFVEAVLNLLTEVSANITVGDDIQSYAGDGFQLSGFRRMCKRAGVRLINLKEAGFVEVRCNGHFLEKVHLSRIALDADVIVNLPKLKTHSLTILTGGVKNMYGTVPIGLRTRLHGEYPRREDFSQVLIDIFSAIRPQLTIMDGIIAMEGEGPASGSLRNLGVILVSQDAVALDTVAAKIIGLDPMVVHTIRYCEERGLGVGNLHNIEVLSERIENVAVHDFKPPTSAASSLVSRVPRFLSRFLVGQLTIKPRVLGRSCTGCLECKKICPVAAISIRYEKAKINHRMCIQCMCCHEVCRFSAIMPKRSIAGATIHFLMTIVRKLMAASA